MIQRIPPITAILLGVACLLTACGGTGGGGSSTPPPDDGPSVATKAELQAVAAAVYDDLADGQEAAAADVSVLFGPFGIPTIPSTDGAAFQAQADAGTPFLFDFQADAIAQRLNEGLLISIDSFVDDLADKGVVGTDGSKLSRADLDAFFAPLLDLDGYTAEQLLPALVLRLGRERAGHLPAGVTDPVWGDGFLDPIQFTLLLYGMNLASQPSAVNATPAPRSGPGTAATEGTEFATFAASVQRPGSRSSTTRALSTGRSATQGLSTQGQATQDPSTLGWSTLGWSTQGPSTQGLSDLLPTIGPLAPKLLKRGVRSLVMKWISRHIHFPLGPIGSTQAAICASIQLYSYRVAVNDAPDKIFLRQYDHPERPYQSDIQATLSFEFQQDVGSMPKQISLWLSACNLPAPGVVSGKPMSWQLDDRLPDLGKLTDKTTTTDATGRVHATYEALDETVPQELRFTHTLKAAVGAVVVKAENLLPRWRNLEAAVRIGRPSLGTGTGFLTVFHYDVPALVLDFESHIRQPYVTWQGAVSATVPLTLVGAGTPDAHYEGEATLSFDSFSFTPPPGDPCTASYSTTDGTLHVTTDPLTESAGKLRLTLAFPQAPLDPATLTCPGGVTIPIDGKTWEAGWVVLHEDEIDPDSNWFAIADWSHSGGAATKVYDRTLMDDGEPLLVESTSLVLTAAP